MNQLPKDMINYRGRISGVGISGSNYDSNCGGLRALSLCVAVALHRPDVVRLNNIWHWWRATFAVISLLPSSPCNKLWKHKVMNFINWLIDILSEFVFNSSQSPRKEQVFEQLLQRWYLVPASRSHPSSIKAFILPQVGRKMFRNLSENL